MTWRRRMLRDRIIFESRDPDACHVAILAGIHGDEKVGFFAFDRLIERLHRQRLLRGRLSLIPGNLPAAEKKRPARSAAAQDMNRLFLDRSDLEAQGLVAQGPDWERAQQLTALLQDVDILLDLHSTSAQSDPFLVTQRIDDDVRALIAGFPLDRLHYDYQRCIPGTAMQCVERHGGRALTVECGSHRQPNGTGARVAYVSAVALLRNVGMLDPGPMKPTFPAERIRLVHRGVVLHPASLQYEPWFKSHVEVKPGAVVARDRTTVYRAPTREVLEQSLGAASVPDRLVAGMVLRPGRVSKLRPYEAFILGVRD